MCDVYASQIWDLASGTLKLSLTGHVSTVRGVAVSPRQPYLFSGGEDKQVKCWDLEYNKVQFIRHCVFFVANSKLFHNTIKNLEKFFHIGVTSNTFLTMAQK